MQDGGGATIGSELARRARAAGAYTVGDQTAPAVILWPDGERRWIPVLEDLKFLLPELYVLGDLEPAERTGPAIWLRCVEACAVEPSPPRNTTPIFYLPGVSRQDLRSVEECPAALEPLVELQFRGAVWSHPNGRDWTPYALLTSPHGGLGLNIPSDSVTAEALARSLGVVLKERLDDLRSEKLDAPFLNVLLSPDLPVDILRWMNAPEKARERKGEQEWEAFCAQCSADYKLHPEKDGNLHAARLLGNHEGEWRKVWKRFAEAPGRYSGVVALLETAAPTTEGMLGLDREYWPTYNAHDEGDLSKALLALKDATPGAAAQAILALDKTHGPRRGWVWREVGRAPLAVALESLGLLATLTRKALAAADAAGIAELYVQSGWEADAAAMAALAAGNSPESDAAIAAAVRSLYLPWLDESARNLQHFVAQSPDCVKPRLDRVEAADGRVVLFVDGLRFDLARQLVQRLSSAGFEAAVEWDWAAIPSVTPTCKPAVSPLAHMLTGGGPEEEFAPCIAATGQRWTNDRFRSGLKEQNIQFLEGLDTGHPSGRAWGEIGSLDSRGHNEGVKSVKMFEQELQEITERINSLVSAGWRELVVVTDHGWLLVPEGLPKIHLAHFEVEHRWGRCAAIKAAGATNLPSAPWHWNPEVTIATPPGAGCFRAGVEYAHGGLSVQESVVPRLTIRAGASAGGEARIATVKWIGLRCRVAVQHAREGLSVDVRGRPADARSSKVEGGRPREIGADGTVSLPIGEDREVGNAAVVVLLGSDGAPVHTQPTVIGENA